MFADINVCEFVILKVFALLKFAILGLSKVNFVFPAKSDLLLFLLIGQLLILIRFEVSGEKLISVKIIE